MTDAAAERDALRALVGQYRHEHDDREQLRRRDWRARCDCNLCDRAEGLGIPAVNHYFAAEDAADELRQMTREEATR